MLDKSSNSKALLLSKNFMKNNTIKSYMSSIKFVQQLYRIYIYCLYHYFILLQNPIINYCQEVPLYFSMYIIYKFNSTPPAGKLKHHGLHIVKRDEILKRFLIKY